MSLHLAMRVNGEWEKVKVFADAKGYGGWAVHELGDSGNNSHWHIHWILPEGVKIQAVRTAFNRAVPELKGNGGYSLTLVQDVEKYDRYMAKGTEQGALPDVAWRHGLDYTDEKVEELHEEYWTENRRLKKRKAGSMVDQVLDACKLAGVTWNQRQEIAKIYIRQVTGQSKPLSSYSLRSCVNTVAVLLCPNEEAIDFLADCALQH